MRYLFPLACLIVVAAGLMFGALNAESITVDLWLLAIPVQSGVALLLAALTGAVAAGICLWIAVIWPQQRRLRRVLRSLPQRATALASKTVEPAA